MLRRLPPREFVGGFFPSAILSSRTNEMGPTGPENPQLPRRFAFSARTSETATEANIGL